MSTSPPTPLPSRWDGFWGRYVISLALASALMVTGVALVNRGINDRVQSIERVAGLDVAPAPPGGANYLIIGSDTRAFVDGQADVNAFGSPTDPNTEGQRSDTLMVAHVEPGPQKTFVVSFPRDLMVNVPGLPGKNRINAAYSSAGGPQAVIDTLKENFGIEINHYLEVNFKSFQEIVDTIGNVQVYLPGRTRDLETGLNTPYGGGCYPLNGAAALAYVRSRNLEISDPNGPIVDDFPPYEHWRLLDQRADLDRIARQQAFIRKLAGLAISKSLSDPFLAVDLADNVLHYVKADEGLSRDDVNALIRAFRTVDVNDTSSVRFETLPVDPDPNNPDVTLVPSADADQVIEQLRTFGDNTPKPATVQPSQVKVLVTDATGTNVGQSVVSKLTELGFKATAASPARTKVEVTEIRYGFDQAEEAKALLPYFTDAKLVPAPKAVGRVELVVGSSFQAITVPSTTTTAPASTVPGAPVTTAPPTTTTTVVPGATDPCP
jgi:LCP family protein required for cell wall assembly